MNKTVFISYSWQEPSAGIVNNWLKPSLKNAGIGVSVDKDNCQYQDSIEQYEKEIGDADMIISLVCRPYLESVNCMYEIASFFAKGGEMANRLFFIGLGDVQSNEEITDFWNNKLIVAQERLKGKSTGRQLYEKELKKIEQICEHLGDFLVYWNDINRLDFSKVSENNFQVVVDRILNRISKIEIPEGELAIV